MAYLPMAVWGLEVPPGDMAISARPDIPSAFRITMAAIDPTAEAEGEGKERATLKILRLPITSDDYGLDSDSDGEDFDPEEMEAMLAEEDESDSGDDDDDDGDVDDDEDVNGGPSDPDRSKKARKAAAIAQIKALLAEEGVDVDDDEGINGLDEGDSDSDDDDDDDDEDEEAEIEEFVICTLDTEKQYQQTLDITIGDDERVWFKVSGTHSVFLTGNYIEPADDAYDEDSEEDSDDDIGYDLEPEEDELDELDNISSRVVEVDEDEEDSPALISDKGKKRAVDEDDLDGLIAKDEKLSKKQSKKQKKNDGTAAEVNGSGKKVAFAKDIEQGPTPSGLPSKKAADLTGIKGQDKPSVSIKNVKGVTLDDRVIGTGPVAKKGDRIGIRYIGKLKDGKVFDANRSGKPFSFKITGNGGEVIKGMDIGVTGMAVGGERRIIIPPHLAYGSKTMPDIPANSHLTFDIKVLEINKGK